ncbi:AMP-binding protein [Alcaligenaceae bacterium]|nr:AMP-binding protein [Alcaligenaceae bacterium]
MSNAMTFSDLIASLASDMGDKPYLISSPDAGVLTYQRLHSQCVELGSFFARQGLTQGDKVSVYLPNGEQTAVLLLGIMANGLVANPVNLMCQESQLKHILLHSDTRLIFTTPELVAALESALRGTGREIPLIMCDPAAHGLPAQVVTVSTQEGSSPAGLPRLEPSDEALIMYTSGTTGLPKGVLLSHENLIFNARNVSVEHRLTAQDRVLGSLPLYHINGLVLTLVTPLVHQGTVVMTPRFSAATFWADACRYECTWVNVVPTIIAYLLNDETPCAELDLTRLRFCRSASSALAPEHHRAFEKRFGLDIIETMGLTETAAPSFSNPYDHADRRVGSIGKPSGTQAKIIGTNDQQVPHGELGEIVLTGKNVMLGYYKDAVKTQESFTDEGWLRTGDVGYQDEQGYFYITGRAKELIIKGGENIAPREIDEAVIKHPSILDAAAVGVPHPEYGQDIAVYLVLREHAEFDVSDMQRHCLAELGKYKSPSRYVVVDELPRGPSGKVQRLKLLDLPGLA